MNGLIPCWEDLPRVAVRVRALSASGPLRDETCRAIPLLRALAVRPKARVTVRCADGLTLALPAADAANAYLTPMPGGGWQLILPLDTTRKRWAKHVESFACA